LIEEFGCQTVTLAFLINQTSNKNSGNEDIYPASVDSDYFRIHCRALMRSATLETPIYSKIANQPNNHSADFELNRLARSDKNRQFPIMSDCYKSKYLKFSNSSPLTFCQADSEKEYRLNSESLSGKSRTTGTYTMRPLLPEFFTSRLNMISRANQRFKLTLEMLTKITPVFRVYV
jgi:hypothetical protein